MSFYKVIPFLLISLIVGCSKDDDPIGPEIPQKIATITSNFESGSIGEINHISDIQWELALRDDNNNGSLPDKWRNWWYVKMDSLSIDTTTEITLKNRGWPYFYTPVYSYNQQQWFRFERDEINQPSSYELQISKQFEHPTVWIARFYPYTFTDLQHYISNIEGSNHLSVSTAGSTENDNPLYLLNLKNITSTDSLKQDIAIHARTHPGETGTSFMLEGLISFLISGSTEAEEILSRTSFSIFPMQNVDGVIAGNYRTTPNSENLEVLWLRDEENPMELQEGMAPEIRTIHSYYKGLGSSVSVALNLHSANTLPSTKPFFFPHFGTDEATYDSSMISLWNNSRTFIDNLAFNYGVDNLEPPVSEGSGSFVPKGYPESWWWANYKDSVMAITMELPYENCGPGGELVTPDHLRELGKALALAIGDYTAGKTPEINWPTTSRASAEIYTEELLKE